jgi:hypothetical protein
MTLASRRHPVEYFLLPLFVLFGLFGLFGAVLKKLSGKSGSRGRPRLPRFVQKRLSAPPAGPPGSGRPGRPRQSGQPEYAAPATLPRLDQAQYQAPHVGVGLNQHRPPEPKLPAPQADVDARARELMTAHNEVGAVRLLCDERDMGIIEAQEYARSLTLPPGRSPATDRSEAATTDRQKAEAEPVDEDSEYGSAAFATSVFDTEADENVWASGWVDKPVQEDRSDLDELWQTVRDAGVIKPS